MIQLAVVAGVLLAAAGLGFVVWQAKRAGATEATLAAEQADRKADQDAAKVQDSVATIAADRPTDAAVDDSLRDHTF